MYYGSVYLTGHITVCMRPGISQDVTARLAISRYKTPILQNRIFAVSCVEPRQVVAYLWNSDPPDRGADL